MAESKVKYNSFVLITGEMIRDLKLKGAELIIFGVIYRFSQDEDQYFQGSCQYLADWALCSRQGAMRALNSLIEKGLVEKRERYEKGVKFCDYRATVFAGDVNKVDRGCQQSLTGGVNKVDIIKDIHNKTDKREDNIVIDTRPRKSASCFSKPTVEEVQAYCREKGYHVDGFRFVNYYESKGWLVGKTPMKDWRAAVRTWESNNKRDINSRPDTGNDDPILNAIFDGTYTG